MASDSAQKILQYACSEEDDEADVCFLGEQELTAIAAGMFSGSAAHLRGRAVHGEA